MRHLYKSLFLAALFAGSVATAADVTFRVDMNGVTGFTTPEVNGTFNGWCGGCAPMADGDGDGVWELTIALDPGTYEYKFAYDTWAGQENLTQGSPCTITTDGFTNRTVTVAGDNIDLGVVCWGSCEGCDGGGGSDLDQIDLPIDWESGETVDYTVTDFGGNASMLTTDPNGDNMALMSTKTEAAELWAGTTLSTPAGLASLIGFSPEVNLISARVWAPAAGMPVRMKAEVAGDPTQSVETEALTTVAGEWETLTWDFTQQAQGTAAINYEYQYNMLSVFYNFGTPGSESGELVFYIDDIEVGEGGGGGTGAQAGNITFRVDMNEFVGDFTTPEVNGTFNAWCGGCAPMNDDDGDGIWEITIPLDGGQYEYKFAYDSWAGQENLEPNGECVLTTGEFTNRLLEVDGDAVLEAYCWSSCEPCQGVSTGTELADERLRLFPNPANSSVTVQGNGRALQLEVYDLAGKLMSRATVNGNEQLELNTANWPAGVYAVRIADGATVARQKLVVTH